MFPATADQRLFGFFVCGIYWLLVLVVVLCS
jgi:hypothetical protein